MRVVLLRLPEAVQQEVADEWIRQLSEERRNSLLRRKGRERLRGLAAEVLLRRLLAEELALSDLPPLRFSYLPQGKPILADFPELHISLSHSGERVACALAKAPVGLDVQAFAGLREGISRRCFTEAEQSFWRQSPQPEEAFYCLWSLKEAFIKYTGAGLSYPLKAVEFARTGQGPGFADFFVRARETQNDLCARAYFWEKGYSLAICGCASEAFPEGPELWRLTDDGQLVRDGAASDRCRR